MRMSNIEFNQLCICILWLAKYQLIFLQFNKSA